MPAYEFVVALRRTDGVVLRVRRSPSLEAGCRRERVRGGWSVDAAHWPRRQESVREHYDKPLPSRRKR